MKPPNDDHAAMIAAILGRDPAIELALLRRRVRVLELLHRPGKEKAGLVSRLPL